MKYVLPLKKDCCGCGACSNVCEYIKMKSDSEGFLYPEVNENECYNCGKCRKVCSSLNVATDLPFLQKGFISQHKNLQILGESTSGGFFSALAEYVIKEKNGVVFGAAFDDNFTVIHRSVDSLNELALFRNSKYCQSNMLSCFREVKKYLDLGRYVLFSGTPCQIEGLFKYLNKSFDCLLTVDVVCRAVPSPLVLKKYIEYMRKLLNVNIGNVKFRDKSIYGYKYSQMSISELTENMVIYHKGIDTDVMLRSFFSNICDRPSCYECKFKKRYRVSDFTMWDCFEPQRFDKSFDNDKGCTCVIAHTEKAKNLVPQLKNIRMAEVNTDDLIEGVHEMLNSVAPNSRRNQFFDDLNDTPFDNIVQKYFPDNAKVKLERFIRKFALKTGIYLPLIRLYKKLKKRNE